MELAGLVAVIAIALVFTYTIGFHDAANAIATSVSTRALTPRAALLLAAAMNLLGGLLVKFSGGVAATVGEDIIALNRQSSFGLLVVFAALAGAIVWNVGTWYLGLPSSSSHALIGGLVGAALASAGSSEVLWGGVVSHVSACTLLSPTASPSRLGPVLLSGPVSPCLYGSGGMLRTGFQRRRWVSIPGG